MTILLPLIVLMTPVEEARTCRAARTGPQGNYTVERDVFARSDGRSMTLQRWSVRHGPLQVGISWKSRNPRLGPPPSDEMAFITLFDLPRGIGEVRMELRRGAVMAAAGGWSDMADGNSHAINLPLYWRELRKAVRAGALTLAVVGRDGRVVAGAALNPAVIEAPGTLAGAARGEFDAKIADWRSLCDPYSAPDH